MHISQKSLALHRQYFYRHEIILPTYVSGTYKKCILQCMVFICKRNTEYEYLEKKLNRLLVYIQVYIHVEKSAKTQTSFRLASHLVRAPSS